MPTVKTASALSSRARILHRSGSGVALPRTASTVDSRHTTGEGARPAIATSVAHTLFLTGEYASAIEAYSGRAAYYLDAAAWAALGDQSRAIALLRERLDRMTLSKLMTALMSSLLAVLEGRAEDAVRLMETADTTREPEIKVYFARHYAQIGLIDSAISALEQAAQLGFVCAPITLTSDVWLSPLGKHAKFGVLLRRLETLVEEAKSSFDDPLRPTFR